MFNSQKQVFWQALLVTILIFGLGIFTGLILENWRAGNVDALFQRSEIDLLDVKIQNQIYSQTNFNCTSAINENLYFADRVYNEAKILERYESASRLSDDIYFEHKKYDVLRTMVWLNSIELRKKCNTTYDEVIYLYNFQEENLNKKTQQAVFSNQLREIKEIKGSEILLIPIAGNLNISSVNLLMELYKIEEDKLPMIVINEKIKITQLKNID